MGVLVDVRNPEDFLLPRGEGTYLHLHLCTVWVQRQGIGAWFLE